MASVQESSPGRAHRPATIRQVAQAAGVSHQTVSRFLRDGGVGLRPETVQRVTEAIEELNYRPNLAARSMRTRRPNRIAVVLPVSTHLVPIRLLNGAASAVHEAGFLLDVVGLEGDAVARSARLRTLLHPDNVDGIISFAPLAESLDGIDPMSFTVPVVVDGEYDDDMRSQGLLADASCVSEILGLLAGAGHRRFFHVAGDLRWASARNRRAAYQAAVARLGLDSRGIVDGDWSVRSGFEAATEVIAGSGATAVFAANDMVAYGVVQGLVSQGLRVPEQVSVFGWDDDEIGRYLRPALSTVSVDRERQGREAALRLLAILRGETPPPALALTSLHRIVLRDSTGPPPAAS
ncbi:LacI family DNA-binding transcriptional regulator [Phytohabitans aurantiacus]|uniref:LacI family transcriptional regulator n=1 Tax=Phytohabitans aurantiacus TaxID=3016789 RepID=A0ABQ5QXU6_9ACTN|nr:LacI family DNA-binding transcriptional regulator [Phytohabitans aurantiacus]GLH99368.1 LacI family transcriptional regulator [Phytohabitans aurantiacus]